MRKIPTEIFSRVSGYFRPVSNYNPGKKAEFWDRRTFSLREISDAINKDIGDRLRRRDKRF
jgi:ribonucleoside-triphosphate reductase